MQINKKLRSESVNLTQFKHQPRQATSFPGLFPLKLEKPWERGCTPGAHQIWWAPDHACCFTLEETPAAPCNLHARFVAIHNIHKTEKTKGAKRIGILSKDDDDGNESDGKKNEFASFQT